jgi:hypothetical protein
MEKLADASQPAVLLNETRYAKANFVPVPQSNGPEQPEASVSAVGWRSASGDANEVVG